MGILGAGHRRGGGHEAGAASGAFTDPVGPVRLERGASGRRYPGAVVPKDAAGVRGVPVALETECGDAMASTPGSLHRGSPVAHAGPAMAHSAWDKLEQLRRAMLDRRILLPVAFLFVWVVIPSPSSGAWLVASLVDSPPDHCRPRGSWSPAVRVSLVVSFHPSCDSYHAIVSHPQPCSSSTSTPCTSARGSWAWPPSWGRPSRSSASCSSTG